MRFPFVGAFRVLTLLFAVSLPSGIHADEQGPALYFPTTVGAKWIYDLDGKEESETLTAIESKGMAIVATIQRIDEFGKKREYKMRLSKDGLFQLSGVGFATKHGPSCRLKLPHKPGQQWEAYTGARGGGFGTLTAFGPEKIKVPAGEFEVIRVETLFPQLDGDDVIGKFWYAPRVGLVKYECGKYVRVLKSFASGKQ